MVDRLDFQVFFNINNIENLVFPLWQTIGILFSDL